MWALLIPSLVLFCYQKKNISFCVLLSIMQVNFGLLWRNVGIVNFLIARRHIGVQRLWEHHQAKCFTCNILYSDMSVIAIVKISFTDIFEMSGDIIQQLFFKKIFVLKNKIVFEGHIMFFANLLLKISSSHIQICITEKYRLFYFIKLVCQLIYYLLGKYLIFLFLSMYFRIVIYLTDRV